MAIVVGLFIFFFVVIPVLGGLVLGLSDLNDLMHGKDIYRESEHEDDSFFDD